MKKKNLYLWVSLHATMILTILLCSVWFLIHTLQTVTDIIPDTKPNYIYLERDPSGTVESLPPSESKQEYWTVKEHEGKIGIFQGDGVLIQILDTYVKTLPKADQKLLGEGFEIDSRDKLNAIIEDYSD